MNQPNTPPGLSLPTPSASAEVGYATPPSMGSTPEAPISRPEAAPMPQPLAPSQPTYSQPAMPAMSPALPQNSPAPAATTSSATVPTDDDLDDESLDAEWVSKARAIVEQTQSDPYKESRALSQVKAEYLQRRHGKEIKVHDAK